MRRTAAIILLAIITVNITACNRIETQKEDIVYTQVKETGYAALYAPYVSNHDYQYAYEVEFSDEAGKPIEKLESPKTIYLPQEELYNCDISLLEVYRLDGDSLTKCKSRYLYDRFMLEVLTDRPGTFVVKSIENAESANNGNMKYMSLLSSRGLTDMSKQNSEIKEREFVGLLTELLGPSVEKAKLGKGGSKNMTRIWAAEILFSVLKEVYGIEEPDTSGFLPKDLKDIPKKHLAAAKLMADRSIIKTKFDSFLPKEEITYALACEMIYKTVYKTKTQPIKTYSLNQGEKISKVSQNGVISFAQVPRMKQSDLYEITANGVPVFVESLFEESIARFAVDGKTEIEITCADNVMGALVSPRTLGIAPKINKNKVKFTIDRPQKLFVQFGNMDRLILCAEETEKNAPKPDGENVINVLSMGADNTGNASATEIIQSAIDEGSKTGKIVYIPDGTYITGLIKIKPNTDLYLEPSAMLFAGEEIENYINESDGKSGCHIEIYNADNVKVHGYGIFRHNGTAINNIAVDLNKTGDINGKKSAIIRGVMLYNCKNVNIDGVYSMDSAHWNTTIIQCQNSEIKNYKAINNVANIFNDGIDPEWCYDLTVDSCLTYTNDDALCVKAGTYYPFKFDPDMRVGNILFKNNTVFTFASGMVFGIDISCREINNVRYENNCIVSADRPISVRNYDWAVLKNVTWKDNVVERVYADPRNEGGHTMLIQIENFDDEERANVDTSTAKCLDFTITGLKSLMDAKNPSVIRGENESKIVKNLVIEGLNFAGKDITEENFRVSIDKYSEVVFK